VNSQDTTHHDESVWLGRVGVAGALLRGTQFDELLVDLVRSAGAVLDPLLKFIDIVSEIKN
jgi:hypothetical protein